MRPCTPMLSLLSYVCWSGCSLVLDKIGIKVSLIFAVANLLFSLPKLSDWSVKVRIWRKTLVVLDEAISNQSVRGS